MKALHRTVLAWIDTEMREIPVAGQPRVAFTYDAANRITRTTLPDLSMGLLANGNQLHYV